MSLRNIAVILTLIHSALALANGTTTGTIGLVEPPGTMESAGGIDAPKSINRSLNPDLLLDLEHYYGNLNYNANIHPGNDELRSISINTKDINLVVTCLGDSNVILDFHRNILYEMLLFTNRAEIEVYAPTLDKIIQNYIPFDSHQRTGRPDLRPHPDQY